MSELGQKILECNNATIYQYGIVFKDGVSFEGDATFGGELIIRNNTRVEDKQE